MKNLASSLVCTYGNNVANCKQHMASNHKDDLWGRQFTVDSEELGEKESSTKMKHNATRSIQQLFSTAGSSVGNEANRHAFAGTKMPKLIVERGNDLQLQFMRSCNVAAWHGNNPALRVFMEHVVDNSQFYSRNKSLMLMGRMKVCNQRYRSFNNLLQVVKTMVDCSRDWLKEQTKCSKIPFITVGHDGWDSKDRDMLGVCIHFIDMNKGKKRTIAVGLQQSHSKKSSDQCDHVLKILQRY